KQVAFFHVQRFRPGGQTVHLLRVRSSFFIQIGLRKFLETVMVRRTGGDGFFAMRSRQRSRAEHEISENARKREQTKRPRQRRKVGIIHPKKHRPERKKNSESPPNAHAEGRADEKDTSDQHQQNTEPEKDKPDHGPALNRRSARTGVSEQVTGRCRRADRSAFRPTAPGSVGNRAYRRCGAGRQSERRSVTSPNRR